MSVVTCKCDACGKEGPADDFRGLHGEPDYCGPCYSRHRIIELRRDIAAKEQWLETTHMQTLRTMKAALAELEAAQ